MGTVSLSYTPETSFCPRHSLLVLSFVHVVPGQVLEGLIQEDDGQRNLEHHHPLAPTQWGHLENERQGWHEQDEEV